MEAQRWRRVWELFELARGLELAQREALLTDACAGDSALRQEVVSLLGSDAEGSLVGGIVGEAAAQAAVGDSLQDAPNPGHRLGPYELIGELGRGGMATVYRARRADDEFEQEVAIKVARGGLGAPELERRFLAERQILARLDHPSIARLLDGGTAENGTAWVAMELVDGLPIDRYCDAEELTLDQRVRLVISVCEAVQYAHTNLVVHRDLKPGNVLVTSGGAPKLLDFGIAKLLGGESGPEWGDRTQTVHRVFTPSYASPEQIRGEPITTGSDVYSLGVMLFQLLIGRRPFDLDSTTSPTELERRILEEEPTIPRSLPGGLGPLPPDLGRILQMALRKEPERRYLSVDQLAADLRRYLESVENLRVKLGPHAGAARRAEAALDAVLAASAKHGSSPTSGGR